VLRRVRNCLFIIIIIIIIIIILFVIITQYLPTIRLITIEEGRRRLLTAVVMVTLPLPLLPLLVTTAPLHAGVTVDDDRHRLRRLLFTGLELLNFATEDDRF